MKLPSRCISTPQGFHRRPVWRRLDSDCRSGDGYDDEVALKKLSDHLDALEGSEGENNRLFYLALPPQLFALNVRSIRKHCWALKGMLHCIYLTQYLWRRAILETAFCTLWCIFGAVLPLVKAIRGRITKQKKGLFVHQ